MIKSRMKMLLISFYVGLVLILLIGQGHGQGNKKKKNNLVTFFPCHTTLLRAERKVNAPPEKTKWEGILNLSSAQGLSPLTVTIIFDFPTNLQLQGEEASILKGSKGNYHKLAVMPGAELVHFTAKGKKNEHVPSVISVRFNDHEVCEDAVRWDLDAPVKEMPAPPPPSGGANEPQVDPVYQQVIVTTTPKPKPQSSCGVRQISKQAYVTNGYASVPGDWPWHAALYHKSGRSISYKCGGTLINNKIILTAAHCLFDAGSPIIPERVIIQLGKYNLQFNDVNTQEYKVYEIKIHDKYSNFDFNDDIALLKLAQQVDFTRYIQPCCLWSNDKVDLANVINRNGFVCGWGLAEDDELSETLTEARMPVVDFFTCLESNRDFFGPVLSNFNYCAGYRNGTSVCNGDSGGGMFFEENGIWHIRGLVSFSAIREDRNVCNPLQFVVFTDIAKYLPWILENM